MKGLLKGLGTGLVLFALIAIVVRGSVWVLEWSQTVDTSVESGRRVVLEDGRQVDLETFVLYLAAAQVPADYGEETLKCQAVIARTFLFREFGDAWELVVTDLDANYWDEADMRREWGLSYEKNRQAFEAAVQATAGQTLWFKGEYIAPVFHQMSAGSTRGADEKFPYLKAMDSPEDLMADENLSIVELSLAEIAMKLEAGTGCKLRGGEFWSKVQIVARDEAGYVELVQIGNEYRTGDEVATMLRLPSPCFSWDAWNGGVRILCRGQGHGYGLSQWGARVSEESGSNYKEILQYYYSGVEIQ